ncbi:MAG: hypothetical protein KatS3mg111_2427 [Pirellulaceae bacterium]|nr:MAG: hypothetical protein KatS3mg111_2427 [Pirellulaceae bacterium]
MLISRRRVRWAVSLGLLSTALLLLAPARERGLAYLLSRSLDERATASRAAVIPHRNLLLIEGLQWQHALPGETVSLRMPECWLHVDRQAILDGRLRIVRGKSDHAELAVFSTGSSPSLSTPRAEEQSSASQNHALHASSPIWDWQLELLRCASQIDWRRLQGELRSFVHADHLHHTWRSRIQQWVQRSDQIVDDVTAVTDRAASANPLREGEDVLAALNRAQSLLEEQSLLAQQFDTLQQLLEVETKQLEQQFAQELTELDARVLQHTVMSEQQVDQLLDRFLRMAALKTWGRQRPMLQGASLLAQHMTPLHTPDLERYVGIPNEDWLELMYFDGAGMARLQYATTPFRFRVTMRGAWHRETPVSGAHALDGTTNPRELPLVLPTATSNWTFEFGTHADTRIRCNVAQPKDQVEFTLQVRRKVSGEPLSPSDVVYGSPPTDSASGGEGWRLLISGTAGDDQLDAVLQLTAAELAAVVADTAAPALPDFTGDGNAMDELADGVVRLRGRWSAPVVTTAGQRPAWLHQLLLDRYQQLLQERLAAEKEILRKEFADRLANTSRLIVRAAAEGQSVLASHREELARLDRSLRYYWAVFDDSAFARRPESPQLR